ncbi:MAG: tRNA (adenosine(37)-N6)-threonylcarbamoyltransferase complex ATPase subunit type 1 TsaE [Bacteroidales bacterium]|nr:tRNA (adenosine(37)-N6)-threonylcarbamoyltransferase complex ATPase subunit type 1 TsaE [Bacteroidales bacterium]
MKEIICKLDDLAAAASEFLEAVGDERLIAFQGHLGAGKTTFIKALCEALGVEDNVCSPTFTIVNEYRAASGEPVYHFDFYRIDSLKEASDLGLEEYFYSGCFCFMEWPEKVAELLPEDTVEVRIEPVDSVTRRITICM